MSNLHGPNKIRRRLYAYVVFSVVLYASAVWVQNGVPRRVVMYLNRIYWRICNRVIGAYRTTSGIVAGLLACLPPLDIVAEERVNVFSNIRRFTRCDSRIAIPQRYKNIMKFEMTEKIFERWRNRINKPAVISGAFKRQIIGPLDKP